MSDTQYTNHYVRDIIIIGSVMVGLVIYAVIIFFQWQDERDYIDTMTCDELKTANLYHVIKEVNNARYAVEKFVGMSCLP